MNRFFTSILPFFLAAIAGTASAAEKTWTGAAGSSWSSPANWQPAGVPANADDVVFDGNVSSISCNLPTTVIVHSLTVKPEYTGTITATNQSSAILTIMQNMHLSGGTLTTGLCKLKVMNELLVDGGTLNKGSGSICSLIDLKISSGSVIIGNGPVEILGNFLLDGGSFLTGSGSFFIKSSYLQNGGSFTKTSGVGTFNPTGSVTINGGDFNCQASNITFKSLSLNNAQFNAGSGSIYFNGNLSLNTASFLKNSGAVYFNSGALFSALNSTFNLGSSIWNANSISFDGGTADLGSGTLIVNGSSTFNQCSISKSGGNSNFNTAFSFNSTNSTIAFGNGLVNTGVMNLDGSTLSFGNGNLTIEGALTLSGSSQFSKTAGNAQLALGSTVTMNSGVVDFTGSTQINTGNWTQLGGSTTCGNSPLFIDGNFEISGNSIFNAPTSVFDLKGDFRRISGTFNHNNGSVRMIGTSSFPYTILGGPIFNNLEISNTSGVNIKKVDVYGEMSVNSNFKLNNGSASNRSIQINTATINIFGNLDITQYRSTEIQPGSSTLRFTGSQTQTIVGTSLNDGIGVLPSIYIDKTGGVFLLSGNVCFGNGFNQQNSTIEFDPEMIFGMKGGSFTLDNLLIPHVRVSGMSTLLSSMAVQGNLEILSTGFLINGNSALNVNAEFINEGRFQNMNGSLNVTGLLTNRGEFSINSGSMNALSGLLQEMGFFGCGTGQVNTIGILSLVDGSFNCSNATVVVSGSVNQTGGTLNGNVNGGSFTISQNYNQTAGIFHGQSGTMNIGVALNLAGTFIRGTGTVNFNGFGPQTIPALFYNKLSIAGSGRIITLAPSEIRISAATAGFAPNATNIYITTNNTINYSNNGNQDVAGFAYNNLSITRSGTKSLSANGSVKNTLKVINSAHFDVDGISNNRVFTLLSSQAQSARIDQIPATASIVGNLTFQRWTRGGIRSNRFIGSPVDTVGGIKFKQVKDNVLLYSTGNAVSGWDNPTLYNNNVYTYNEALANGFEWRYPLTTNEVIPRGSAILIYHLGDRTQVNLQNNTIPNAAIVDFKGVPIQGDITLPVNCTGGCIPTDNGNGWNLVANPYASPIDWDSPEWTKTGISSTIYIWNPRINQYASYNSQNPGAATNGGSRYIGPGQGFFMKATENNPVLIAHEKIKSAQFPDTLLFRMSAAQSQLRLVINQKDSEVQDEAVLEFRNEASDAFEVNYDSHKPELPGMSLSFSLLNESGDALSVHAFAEPDMAQGDKIIPIRLKAEAGLYYISASQLESFGNNVSFYLEDRLMKSIVKLEEGKSYNITVESNQTTNSTGRLNLILRHEHANASSIVGSFIRVFPNPSNGSNVQVVLPKAGKGTLEIYSMLGTKLLTKSIDTAQNTIALDSINQLAAGIYTIVWNSSEGRYSELLTVK